MCKLLSILSPLQKRFGRFTTEPNRTKLYNPGFEKEMEQTVDHSKRYTFIGLGIIFFLLNLNFFFFFFFSDTFFTSEREAYTIPEWVKANAGWWSEGHISDSEFSNTLQWLFDHGFVEIRKCDGRCLEEFEQN